MTGPAPIQDVPSPSSVPTQIKQNKTIFLIVAVAATILIALGIALTVTSNFSASFKHAYYLFVAGASTSAVGLAVLVADLMYKSYYVSPLEDKMPSKKEQFPIISLPSCNLDQINAEELAQKVIAPINLIESLNEYLEKLSMETDCFVDHTGLILKILRPEDCYLIPKNLFLQNGKITSGNKLVLDQILQHILVEIGNISVDDQDLCKYKRIQVLAIVILHACSLVEDGKIEDPQWLCDFLKNVFQCCFRLPIPQEDTQNLTYDPKIVIQDFVYLLNLIITKKFGIPNEYLKLSDQVAPAFRKAVHETFDGYLAGNSKNVPICTLIEQAGIRIARIFNQADLASKCAGAVVNAFELKVAVKK